VSGQRHAPAALHRERDPVPTVPEDDAWVWGRSGRVRKVLPPPGFEPQTIQHVASHYNDYATPAALLRGKDRIFIYKCRLFLVFKGLHLRLNNTEIRNQMCKG
jgi:hypothetical protein